MSGAENVLSVANIKNGIFFATGVIRGILCNECNRGLGYFKDNVHSLARAIEYLTEQESIQRKESAHAIST